MNAATQLNELRAVRERAGLRLLQALAGSGQALRLYPSGNAAVGRALAELEDASAGAAAGDGRLSIEMVDGFFFLGETRLRLSFGHFASASFLGERMRRHGVGAIDAAANAPASAWIALLEALEQPAPAGDDAFPALAHRLADGPGKVFELRPTAQAALREDENTAGRAERLAGAREVYGQACHTVQGVLTDARLGRAIDARPIRRAVETIVDQVVANEDSIIAMTTLRDHDDYTYQHSVNVAIFAVVVGQRLGFEHARLVELGVAGVLHDIGKLRVKGEVLRKAGKLDSNEWDAIREHPTDGLLLVYRMHGLGVAPWRTMIAAYEHHMKMDLTGYPRSRRPRRMSLISRIVMLADAFDAGTSVRAYDPEPPTPDEVLQEMLNNPARGHDPLLVKALIHVTGIFPVGSLVILDSHELAIVIRRNDDPARLHQPVVKILADASALTLALPLLASLDEMDPATGKPRRSVLKTADPDEYGIRVSDYVTR